MKITDVKIVTVIGAGDMGHGIAESALLAGYRVNLQDVRQEFVDRGVKRIGDSLDKFVSKGIVPDAQRSRIMGELLKPLK